MRLAAVKRGVATGTPTLPHPKRRARFSVHVCGTLKSLNSDSSRSTPWADNIVMQAIKTADFLSMIDKLLALAPGTVKGPETLANFEAWDSLAAIGFVALLDDKLGVTIPSGKLEHCTTVADLLAIAGSQVQS